MEFTYYNTQARGNHRHLILVYICWCYDVLTTGKGKFHSLTSFCSLVNTYGAIHFIRDQVSVVKTFV